MTHSGRRVTLKRIFLCLITAAVISAAIAFAGQMWLRQISGADRVKLSDFYLFAGISAFIIFVLTLRPARRPLAFFKNIGRALLLAALTALVWAFAFLWVGQSALLYPPVTVNERAEEALKAMPQAEELSVPGENGENYHGWLIKGGAGKAGLILYFGGNGEESSARAETMARPESQQLLAGCHFMSLDPPGVGRSPGERSEESIYRMAKAAWAYAASRPEADPEKIVLAGWSLGSGTALRLAEEMHPAGLIIFAPFYNGSELVTEHVQRLLKITLPFSLPARDAFRSARYARNVQAPALVVAARDDRAVPYEQSRRLAELLPAGRLITLESGGHGTMWSDPASLAAVQEFLGEL